MRSKIWMIEVIIVVLLLFLMVLVIEMVGAKALQYSEESRIQTEGVLEAQNIITSWQKFNRNSEEYFSENDWKFIEGSFQKQFNEGYFVASLYKNDLEYLSVKLIYNNKGLLDIEAAKLAEGDIK